MQIAGQLQHHMYHNVTLAHSYACLHIHTYRHKQHKMITHVPISPQYSSEIISFPFGFAKHYGLDETITTLPR